MPLSEARKRANKKWDAENMQNLSVKVRRDYADKIRAKAAERGTTPGAIMRKALDDFMKEEDCQAISDAMEPTECGQF